jgi:hypothetical protein
MLPGPRPWAWQCLHAQYGTMVTESFRRTAAEAVQSAPAIRLQQPHDEAKPSRSKLGVGTLRRGRLPLTSIRAARDIGAARGGAEHVREGVEVHAERVKVLLNASGLKRTRSTTTRCTRLPGLIHGRGLSSQCSALHLACAMLTGPGTGRGRLRHTFRLSRPLQCTCAGA